MHSRRRHRLMQEVIAQKTQKANNRINTVSDPISLNDQQLHDV